MPEPGAPSTAPRRPPLVLLLLLGGIGLLVGVALALLLGRSSPPPAPPAPLPDEATLERLAHDPRAIARGRTLWLACAGCHGTAGQGAQGPNVRDDYWLHGSSMRAILTSIRDGYPAAGMPSWGAAGLPDADQQALAAYVASLHGSEDGSGKPPQGFKEPIRY